MSDKFNWKSMKVSSSLLLLFLMLIANSVQNANTKATADLYLSKEPKIVGGVPITIQHAPYQVSIRLKNTERQSGYGRGHICGGSVITQRVVLTAAHCIAYSASSVASQPPVYRWPYEFTVVIGSAQLYNSDSNTKHYGIQQLVPHAGFNLTTLANDIALMFIIGLIPRTWPTITAIPLNTQAVAANTMCSVSGWGKMSNNKISSVLMSGNVPIVSNSVCSTNYGSIADGMLCAGFMNTGGTDACQGDSGGPLVCNGNLVGIVSWGNGCGLVGYPGVYTNVSYYNAWITRANATLDYSFYVNGSPAGILGAKQALLVALSLIFILISFEVRNA